MTSRRFGHHGASAALKHHAIMDAQEHRRECFHSLGQACLILTGLVLAWDVAAMFHGSNRTSLSGIADIWAQLDKASLSMFQSLISGALGAPTWDMLFKPIIYAPTAAVCAPLGLFLVIKFGREITVRAPTRLEMEIARSDLARRR